MRSFVNEVAARSGSKAASVGGRLLRPFFGVAKDFDMKAFIAACIAAGALWAVDVRMNDGRYSTVIENAVIAVFPK
jgi:hypothetical protein